MEQIGDMKMYSLDEFIDEEIGTSETQMRKEFDSKVAAKVERISKANSYHFVMPVSLHDSVKKRASQLGTSISEYINSLVARDLQFA